jgi:alkaline phosphatase
VKRRSLFAASLFLLAAAPALFAQHLAIQLPERTRLLEDQRLDLVIEVRNAASLTGFRVLANGADITRLFSGPRQVDLDCNGGADYVYRADLISFATPGTVRLDASINASGAALRALRDIGIQAFNLSSPPRNVILLIGDGMAEAYRDAARLVARSVEIAPGIPGLREGFYDWLLEMDQMPVSGMVINHGSDRVIPDSANSASALATGNKTFDGAISVFGDGTDCVWLAPGATADNLWAALDNPRVETIAEYLKRRFNYRVGLVTTAALADATPAAFATHMGERDAAFEVTRQYLESPLFGNRPVADVLMGGGKESFDPDIRTDGRNLAAEFQALGYKLVTNAAELRAADPSAGKLLGLFRRPNSVSRHSSRIRPSSAGHMDVAYDKLRLQRPGSEPLPNFGAWPDQPFLDDMTRKAIEALSGPGNQPFFLMVEGASIDKQSHSGHAAGTIWDTIEFDKAVGVARAWAQTRPFADTLLIVTADHGQTMTVIGLAETPDQDYFDRSGTIQFTVTSPVGNHTATVYKDVNTNVRANLPWGSSSAGTGPPAYAFGNIFGIDGFPTYTDENGDGYPENRAVAGKTLRRLSVGFRTGSHAGVSLPLSAEGPGAFLFTGYMDQTDVPLKIGAALGTDTSFIDRLLRDLIYNPAYPRTFGKFR